MKPAIYCDDLQLRHDFGVDSNVADRRRLLILDGRVGALPADDLDLRSAVNAGIGAIVPLKALLVFGTVGIGLLFGIVSIPPPSAPRMPALASAAADEQATIPAALMAGARSNFRPTASSNQGSGAQPTPPPRPAAPQFLTVE
jgi:hypothetical protein